MMSPPLSGCWLPEADCPMCQFGKLRSQLRNPYLIWSMQKYLRCSNFEKILSREKCRKVILVCVWAVSIGPEENSHDGNSPLFFKLFEVRNIWRKEKGTRTMVFPSIRGIWSSRLVATKTHRTRRGLTRWGEPSLFQITIKLETKTEQMGERLTESRRNRWKGNPNGGSPRQGAQKSFAINTSPFTIFVINFRQIINNIRLITNHVQPNPPSFCHLC